MHVVAIEFLLIDTPAPYSVNNIILYVNNVTIHNNAEANFWKDKTFGIL